MTLAAELLHRYESHGIRRGGRVLYDHTTALKILEECALLSIRVVGIDIFLLNERDNSLVQLNSTDYSSVSKTLDGDRLTVLASRRLLESGIPDGGNYVSFVLRSR